MNESEGSPTPPPQHGISPTPPPQGGTSPTPPPQGGTSPTPSMMDQIRVSMQQNMSQLLQKDEQEEERWRNKIASLEAEMQETINGFLDERSILEAKVESLECTLYDKQQYINSLLQENDKLGETVESMERRLCDRRQDINMLVEENNTLEDKVESMECTLDERQQNINSLQQENDMLQDTVEDLKQTCSLYERQENIKSLQQEKSMLDAKVEGLEHTLSLREQNINSLQQENNMLQAKVEDLEHTLHERQQSIDRFQNSNDMIQDKVEDLEETLYERRQNMNRLLQAKDNLQAKVQDLEHTLRNKQHNITSFRQENDVLLDEVDELKETLRERQQDINRFQQENDTLQDKLFCSKQDVQNMLRRLHATSYTMRARQKNGRALIINNTKFTELSERTGAEGDPRKLAEALQSLLVDIEVKTHQNLDLSTMQHVLRDEANRDHTDEDFFICCIMTHGAQGKVYAADGFSADLLDILSLFKGKRCPSLMGKPKLFFIQACQGDRRQTAVEIAGAQDSDANPSPIQAYFSTEADFFLALATVPGYVAYRRDDGADFVNILANVLKEQGKSQDLMSMMATVSKELNAKYEYSPFCCTTLRHKLFFKLYAHTWNHLPTCTLYPTIETPNHGLYRTRPSYPLRTLYPTTEISNYRVEFRPELTYPLRLPALYPTSETLNHRSRYRVRPPVSPTMSQPFHDQSISVPG